MSSALHVSGSTLINGAAMAAEAVTVLILTVFKTFFMLRDGSRFVNGALGLVDVQQRTRFRRAADQGWAALGGYLRGVVLLGAVESVIMGVTLLLVGARLIIPVMILTFVLAFIPVIGAVAAGVIAALVALVTAGVGPAVIVAVVALVVQQLDNDLLAPVIYGRALSLHPAAVLLSVVAGGALFGLAGTVLAVPVVAVGVAVVKELRRADDRPALRRNRKPADHPPSRVQDVRCYPRNSRVRCPVVGMRTLNSEPAGGSSSGLRPSREVVMNSSSRLGPPNVHAVTWWTGSSTISSTSPAGV